MTHRNLVYLILFFSSIGVAFGQNASAPRLLLGPMAEFAFGLDQGNIPVFGGSPGCGLFSSGRTLAPSIGGMISSPSFFSSTFGLVGSARLSFPSGRLTATPADELWTLHPTTKELVRLQEEYRLANSSLALSVDLLASLRLSERFSLAAGPFFDYRFSSSFAQTENLIAPTDMRLANGLRKGEMIEGSNPQGMNFSFGPSLAATYALPLGSNKYLVPGLSFRADLLSAVRDYSWRSYRIGGNLSLLFDITPSPPVVEPPSPPSVEPPSRTPLLAASVGMYGIDKENNSLPSARIQVYETLFQQYAPLLPALFFEEGSATLPDRYGTLRSGETADFSVDGLAGTDVLKIQHQGLNIIGLRLRLQKDATITLVGSVSGDEDSHLARARAESVRAYLTEVWGIEPSRVQVKEGTGLMQRSSEETEDGRGDNRRVEMASGDSAIFAPVVTSRIVRDFDPPLVRIVPEFTAEAGVKEWSLVISQQGHEMARYGGHNAADTDAIDMEWRIEHTLVDSALSPLRATLTVRDSVDGIATADATLPMTMLLTPRVVDRRVERSGGRERLASNLVGFEFSSAAIGGQNSRALQEVAAAVRNGAHITLVGYTDRIGDQERNEQLAQERAAAAAEALQGLLKERGVKGVNVEVLGGGVETARFDNDLPEGRVLSRGVGIVVEQTEGDPSQP